MHCGKNGKSGDAALAIDIPAVVDASLTADSNAGDGARVACLPPLFGMMAIRHTAVCFRIAMPPTKRLDDDAMIGKILGEEPT